MTGQRAPVFWKQPKAEDVQWRPHLIGDRSFIVPSGIGGGGGGSGGIAAGAKGRGAATTAARGGVNREATST